MDNLHVIPGKRWLKILLLFLSDLVGFGIAIGLIAFARHQIFRVAYSVVFDTPGILTLVYVILFSLIMLAARGLYPGWARSSVVEFRQIVEAITLAYVLTSMIIFIQRSSFDFSRSVFILSWFFSIFFLPVGRFLVRNIISRFPWWGEPVVVIGTSEGIREAAGRLESCPRIGLRPAAGLSIDGSSSRKTDPFLVMPWSQKRLEQVRSVGIQTSILTIPPGDLGRDYPIIYRQLEFSFNKSVFLLNDEYSNFMMSQPLDIAGQPALFATQTLSEPVNLFLKRLIDIALVVIFFIPFLVVGCLLTLWVKIDSPGPIFFIQERVGRDRKIFRLYKFRTMVQNQEEVLAGMLKDPMVRAGWNHYHKLVNDQRITRAGRWLRRLSLDELPQVFNIVRGEMSLVGPRPYLQTELDQLGVAARTVLRVRPGITGWWQVMGRNNMPFQERIRLEIYYVSNWSLWLDLFIIIKTFWVVFFLRDGQ